MIGEAHDEAHVVLDQQYGEPFLLEPRQRLRQLALFHVAEARGRLVEQQQDRIEAQCARDLDDAELAQRKAAGGPVHVRGKTHTLDLARGLIEQARFLTPIEARHARKGAAAPTQMRAEGDILQDAHAGQDVDMLKGAPNATARDELGGPPRNTLAPEFDLSRRRPQDARHQIEDGALAGAVGADEADDLARAHVETDIVDGDQAAEFLAHRLQREQRFPRLRHGAGRQRLGLGGRGSWPRSGNSAARRGHSPSRAVCSRSTSSAPNTMVS